MALLLTVGCLKPKDEFERSNIGYKLITKEAFLREQFNEMTATFDLLCVKYNTAKPNFAKRDPGLKATAHRHLP